MMKALALSFLAATLAQAAPATQPDAPVKVARLVYANGRSTDCFAENFLDDVGRETRINIHRRLEAVQLGDADLFNYPLVVFSGEGAFELSEREIDNLRVFLRGGGFILASASCSDGRWGKSFERAMRQVTVRLDEVKPKTSISGDVFFQIPENHRIYKTIYEIPKLRTRQVTDEKPALWGIEVSGRLAVVFSPLGLNNTAEAGGSCCCCGGNEIREARKVNANVVAWVLTH